MESKVILIVVLNILSFFGYAYIMLTIGDVKGWILFGLMVFYALARLVFFIIKQNQDRIIKNFEIREKERRENDEIFS